MNSIKRLSFLLMICLSVGLAAQSCKSTKDKAQNISDLEGMGNIEIHLDGTWILKSLNGQNVSDVFKGKTPTMNLNFKESRVFGNGGCNSYTGKFSYKDGIFSAPNVAATMMACFQENKESDFFAMLGGQNTVKVINGVLTFMNGGKTVAEFVKGVDPSMLSGKWVLESIADQNLQTLFPEGGRTATLEFDAADGRVKGNAGCNGYGATYAINSTIIEVGPIMSTKMACPNLSGETKFVETLSGTSMLDATTDKLTFSKNGKVTLTFVKEKN